MSGLNVHRFLVVAAATVISAGLVVGSASAASAHEALSSTNPEAGASVSELPAVELVFTDVILDEPTAAKTVVIGPDDRYYETGCSDVDEAVMTTPVALGAAGEYRVLWRAVSGDGHPISDEYSFTYQPAAGAAAAAGRETPACGDDGQLAEESPAAQVTVAPSDLASESPASSAEADAAVVAEQGAPVWVWVVVAVGVVAVIAIVAAVVRGLRRKTP